MFIQRLRAELLDRERIIAELRTQIGAQRVRTYCLFFMVTCGLECLVAVGVGIHKEHQIAKFGNRIIIIMDFFMKGYDCVKA